MNNTKSERVSPSFGHNRSSSNNLMKIQVPSNLRNSNTRKKNPSSNNILTHLSIETSPEIRN